jgi:glycosyltransferase involved in cell wall biosynthesis
MVSTPLVSIGMPIYNEEKFLQKAIESVINQTYHNLEIIISDNASTDETSEICKKFVNLDARIRYYRNKKNIASINNFTKVFSYTSGEYFMWASGHDLRDPTFIEKCVAELNNDNSMVLCYSKGYSINSDGILLEELPGNIDTRGYSLQKRIKTTIWPVYAYQVYGVIRSASLKRTGLFKPVLGPDVVLLFELSCLGSFGQINEHLMYLRNISDSKDLNVYWMKCFNRPVSLYSYNYRFFQMLSYLIRASNRQLKGIDDKLKAIGAVFIWFVKRGSFILAGACIQIIKNPPQKI